MAGGTYRLLMWDDEPDLDEMWTGKWLVPVDAASPIWEQIKQRTLTGELTHQAKASLPESGRRGMTCVYTHDCRDLEDVGRVLRLLRPLVPTEWLKYKTDVDTLRLYYGKGAALYTSPPGRTRIYTERDGLPWLPLGGQQRRWAAQ